MLKFWSYQKEYIKNKKILLNLIDKSISSGSIFFGKNLELFEKTFTDDILMDPESMEKNLNAELGITVPFSGL